MWGYRDSLHSDIGKIYPSWHSKKIKYWEKLIKYWEKLFKKYWMQQARMLEALLQI